MAGSLKTGHSETLASQTALKRPIEKDDDVASKAHHTRTGSSVAAVAAVVASPVVRSSSSAAVATPRPSCSSSTCTAAAAAPNSEPVTLVVEIAETHQVSVIVQINTLRSERSEEVMAICLAAIIPRLEQVISPPDPILVRSYSLYWAKRHFKSIIERMFPARRNHGVAIERVAVGVYSRGG